MYQKSPTFYRTKLTPELQGLDIAAAIPRATTCLAPEGARGSRKCRHQEEADFSAIFDTTYPGTTRSVIGLGAG